MLAAILGPEEIAREVAGRARALRLARNQSQESLAIAAGVSLAAIKRFEHSGEIAFVSLVRVAVALDATAELESWFTAPPVVRLDDAIAQARPRRRGRR